MNITHHDNGPGHAMSDPGDLLANIPAILGFYPRDSVVLAGFLDEEGDSRFTLGPILRLDLTDLRYLPDAAEALDRIGVSFVFAFVVGEEEMCRDRGVYDVLLGAASSGDIGIVAAWHTPDIATGSPYALLFAEQSATSSTWLRGEIPLVADSAAMRELVEAGELPDVDRQEALDFFRLDDDRAAIHARTATASNSARLLEHELMASKRRLDRELRRIASLLDDHGAEAEDALAVWMSRTWLRDCCLATVIERASVARAVLLRMGQRYEGAARANALTLFAALLGGEPTSFRIPMALGHALHEDPSHRLAQLLLEGYRRGMSDSVLETMKAGSLATIETIGQLGGEAAA